MQDDGTFSRMEIKTGDKVLFGSFAGTEVNANEEEFLIMSEDDILAVVE